MSDRRLCVHVWRYRTLNLCDMCWRWEAEAAEKRAEDAEADLKQIEAWAEGLVRERDAARAAGAEYIRRTDPVIACASEPPEKPCSLASPCRMCALEALAASQALVRSLREALREFGSHVGNCPTDDELSHRQCHCGYHAVLAESPDHVAPAPEALGFSGYIMTGLPQEATASPAPEVPIQHDLVRDDGGGFAGSDAVRCSCGFKWFGLIHRGDVPPTKCPRAAPPEEAAPQAQEEDSQ